MKEDGRSFASTLARSYVQLLELGLLVIVVVLAISSISEMAARQAVHASFEAAIDRLQADFISRTHDSEDGSAITSSRESARDRDVLVQELRMIRELQARTSDLVMMGADSELETLRAIRRHAAEVHVAALMIVTKPDDAQLGAEVGSPYSGRAGAVGILDVVLRVMGGSIGEMGNDHLLALAIMACSAIGTFIAGLRSNQLISIRTLALGVATGFVVYLAIKGGTFFFMLNADERPMLFNPYGSAFSGLIAGLFTEKAYAFLASVVEKASKKIEETVGR